MRKFSVIMLISIISAFFVQKCFAFDGVEVSVPVYYENISNAGQSCTVYMESVTQSGGVFDKKIVESGTETNFDVQLNAAGIYDYKIYRDIGNETDTLYDKTVYFAEITVFDIDNELSAAVNIYIQDGGKMKRASYVDRKKAAPKEKEKSSDETDKKDDPKSSDDNNDGGSNGKDMGGGRSHSLNPPSDNGTGGGDTEKDGTDNSGGNDTDDNGTGGGDTEKDGTDNSGGNDTDDNVGNDGIDDGKTEPATDNATHGGKENDFPDKSNIFDQIADDLPFVPEDVKTGYHNRIVLYIKILLVSLTAAVLLTVLTLYKSIKLKKKQNSQQDQ